jgi:hypothetical protein
MNEHRLHQTWSVTSNIAARRRRARAATRRLARMRARMARAHTTVPPRLLEREPTPDGDSIS